MVVGELELLKVVLVVHPPSVEIILELDVEAGIGIDLVIAQVIVQQVTEAVEVALVEPQVVGNKIGDIEFGLYPGIDGIETSVQLLVNTSFDPADGKYGLGVEADEVAADDRQFLPVLVVDVPQAERGHNPPVVFVEV